MGPSCEGDMSFHGSPGVPCTLELSQICKSKGNCLANLLGSQAGSRQERFRFCFRAIALFGYISHMTYWIVGVLLESCLFWKQLRHSPVLTLFLSAVPGMCHCALG